MYLIVSIDTEEDMPDWRPEWPPQVKNIFELPGLHKIFTYYKVKPTYLVDWPVLEDSESLNIIKRLKESKECEIGAHIHSWHTPPITAAEKCGQATYLSNLPIETCRAKIENFVQFFEHKLGFLPISHRSGRYGFNNEIGGLLSQCGFKVDSSIAPLMDYRKDGGICFRLNDVHPFMVWQNPNNQLLEVPITIALVHRFSKRFDLLYFRIPDQIRLKGVLHRLNLARLLWLRPTTFTFNEMKQLADHVLDKLKCPVLHLMFHSSEACAGTSPYNQTHEDVIRFLRRLNDILSYLTLKRRLKSVTLGEYAKTYWNRS